MVKVQAIDAIRAIIPLLIDQLQGQDAMVRCETIPTLTELAVCSE
jgi:hypothetical protein